ncbi:hypothetical protein ACLGIH_22385 [Streptomyces sp. HMX87]|uniref:hypothetical protein n=1 Tax=Streptomyces sp. HMX87 TaxID=3390849 RepID=UPI003A89672A
MKSLKAAAVIAGSVVLAGAATPALAQAPGGAGIAPTGLDGAVDTLAKGPVHVVPLHHRPDVLGTENPESKDSVLDTVKGAATQPNPAGGLLGGLPLNG